MKKAFRAAATGMTVCAAVVGMGMMSAPKAMAFDYQHQLQCGPGEQVVVEVTHLYGTTLNFTTEQRAPGAGDAGVWFAADGINWRTDYYYSGQQYLSWAHNQSYQDPSYTYSGAFCTNAYRVQL